MTNLTIVWKEKPIATSALCVASGETIGFITTEVSGFMSVTSKSRVGDTMKLPENAQIEVISGKNDRLRLKF